MLFYLLLYIFEIVHNKKKVFKRFVWPLKKNARNTVKLSKRQDAIRDL